MFILRWTIYDRLLNRVEFHLLLEPRDPRASIMSSFAQSHGEFRAEKRNSFFKIRSNERKIIRFSIESASDRFFSLKTCNEKLLWMLTIRMQITVQMELLFDSTIKLVKLENLRFEHESIVTHLCTCTKPRIRRSIYNFFLLSLQR